MKYKSLISRIIISCIHPLRTIIEQCLYCATFGFISIHIIINKQLIIISKSIKNSIYGFMQFVMLSTNIDVYKT